MPYHIETQDTYCDRQAHDPRGQDDLLRCARACAAASCTAWPTETGRHQDRARPPPRRHRSQTLFLNMFFGGKLKAMPPKLRQRRRRAHRDPPAGLRARGATSTRCAAHAAVPHHPLQPVRLARRTCSASRWATCCATGTSSSPGALENMLHRPAERGALVT
ncbi:MAG: hypothetical protein MZV70_07210 [Desulfobacterales bacterium]|nr:hypothetical protein [Desulfobacterales bacterium]